MWQLAARIENRLLMLSARSVIRLVLAAFVDRPSGHAKLHPHQPVRPRDRP